ncbi:MAG: GNAT family N-acetyltransferase [Oscillospiraceae bacterium]|nr:GNAT family N-acetyltransferase [Oscillospiraceae bacterium]
MEQNSIRLTPMTPSMYHRYFREYENDPDLYLDPKKCVAYVYNKEKVDQYIQRQIDLKRIPLAILYDDEIVGEVVIKNIEKQISATMGLTLKTAKYKNRGIGTQAERLVIQYVFNELDIPTLYADTIRTNTRSQHVLEKVGFVFIWEDKDFRYYRIDRDSGI